VVQDVLTRLDQGYQAFFCRVKAGEAPGYPRLQGAQRYHSFTDKPFGTGATLDNGLLVLSTIGRLAVRWSRSLEGVPTTVTISKEVDGWYACFSCAEVPVLPLPPTGSETGRDVGLNVFLATADGEPVEHPRHSRRGEKRWAKAQRRVSRRTKGSTRRKKAGVWLANAHQHVTRPRAEHHHTTALDLLRQYDTLAREDVPVANLARNHQLAKSSSDAGWAQVRTILASKAACAGKRVVAVPPAFTTQDGSGCGERIQKSLSMRTHACTSCGRILDRDLNAARNRLRAGQARQGAVALAAAMH
jgi:putative transposase